MENKINSQDRNVQLRMQSAKNVTKQDISTKYANPRKGPDREPILSKHHPRMMMTPTLTKMVKMVNVFKQVNHIEATKGSQGKHLKFPIAKHPKGPYKHHIVVRVDTGADVKCMKKKTFNNFFPEVELSVCPHEMQKFNCRHLNTGTILYLLGV